MNLFLYIPSTVTLNKKTTIEPFSVREMICWNFPPFSVPGTVMQKELLKLKALPGRQTY
jgi:hypothetical protein